MQDLGLISDRKEAQILQVLEKIKRKDPAVFDPDAKFFSESESEEDGAPSDANGMSVLVGPGHWRGGPGRGHARALARSSIALRRRHARFGERFLIPCPALHCRN